MSRILVFWQELKRRNVVRRNTVYAATAFVILELVSIIQDPLNLPEWTLRMVIILLVLGFIISIIVSWIYETDQNGNLVKTVPASPGSKEDIKLASPAWKAATYISFAIIIALVVLNIRPRKQSALMHEDIEKSIAVLPLENMSNDKEHSYFGDAMTDEIIMQLNKIAEFSVRSRTSVMKYKLTEKSSPFIGEELKVNYLVEGSAQRFEDQVRIRVKLILSSHDKHLWSKTYEGKWSDILTFQSRIAQEIASELKILLSSDEINDLEKVSTENATAYELYLKARYFQNQRSNEGFTSAIYYYMEALRHDPEFAAAYNGIAFSRALQGIYNFLPMSEALPKAYEAATQAVMLDKEHGDALATFGLIKSIEGDLAASEKEYLKSVKFQAKSAEAHHGFSYILSWRSKHERAIEEAKIALSLEPVNPIMIRGLGYTYYFDRQYDKAIEAYHKCLEMDSTQVIAYQWLSWAYHSDGLYAEAITSLADFLVELGESDQAEQLKMTYFQSGYTVAITQLVEISREHFIRNISGPFWNSILLAMIGEHEKAMHSLEEYVLEDYPWRLYSPEVFPYYDSISLDPGMPELLNQAELKKKQLAK